MPRAPARHANSAWATQSDTALPYRNYVAQALLGVSEQEHEAFFRDMLGDIDEPTLPFGWQDVRGDGNQIEEYSLRLDAPLNRGLRAQARLLGVSTASLFHLAWAQVLAATSGDTTWYSAPCWWAACKVATAPTARWGCLSIPCRCVLDIDG